MFWNQKAPVELEVPVPVEDARPDVWKATMTEAELDQATDLERVAREGNMSKYRDYRDADFVQRRS